MIRSVHRVVRQDGTDEADQGVAVGEDPHDVGAPPDLLVEPFLYPALGGRVNLLRVSGGSAVEAFQVVGEGACDSIA